MKKTYLIIFILVALSYLINIIALQFVPDKIATHWDIKGEPDGCMPKIPGLLLLSVILTLIAAIEIIIPRLKESKEKFANYMVYYEFFSVWVIMFLFFINMHIVLWNTEIFKLHPQHVFYTALFILFAGLICVAFRNKR